MPTGSKETNRHRKPFSVCRYRYDDPSYLDRLLRFAVHRWLRARTVDRSVKYFAAMSHTERLQRMAMHQS